MIQIGPGESWNGSSTARRGLNDRGWRKQTCVMDRYGEKKEEWGDAAWDGRRCKY